VQHLHNNAARTAGDGKQYPDAGYFDLHKFVIKQWFRNYRGGTGLAFNTAGS
jgi:hypothetical protein